MVSKWCGGGGGEKVPLWRKLTYAVGSMPYSMTTALLGFYFAVFLLEVVIIDPVYVLIIIFSGRVWDAFSDSFIGYLVSLTKTRFGRLRPWLAVSMVPAGVAYFLVWYTYPLDDHPQYIKFIYYLIVYFVLMSLLSGIHVPYTSLTMHMTDNVKERDSITFYRICFEMLGIIVGVYIFTGFYLGLVQFSKSSDCDNGLRVPDPHRRAVYSWHALTIGILVVLCVLITTITAKEQKEEAQKSKRVGLWRGLKDTVGYKPYFYLLMINLFSWTGFQFLQGNAVLYVKYSLGLEQYYPYIIALLLVCSVLWSILWQAVIIKFGKKTAMFSGLAIVLPILILLLFLDYFPLGAFGAVVVLGMGVSCAYLVPWSMLPDVIDESILTRGIRREELFYAFFVFVVKLSGGLALGVSTAVYKIAGYDESLCEQPWTVPLALKLIMAIPPFFSILLTFVFLHYYPITEQTREKTRRLLAEKKAQSMNNGAENLEPFTSDTSQDSDTEEASEQQLEDHTPLLTEQRAAVFPEPADKDSDSEHAGEQQLEDHMPLLT